LSALESDLKEIVFERFHPRRAAAKLVSLEGAPPIGELDVIEQP